MLGAAETGEGCGGGGSGVCVPCEMGRMAAGVLSGSTFAWTGNTTGQGRRNSLVSSKIRGKCPVSQVKAGVSWICHPSSAACDCLVVAVACLWHTWKTGSSALLLGPPGYAFSRAIEE